MKNLLIAVLLITIVAVAGYVGVPVLIEKKTAALQLEIADLRQKIERMEDESRVAPLLPEADATKIVKTVNALAFRASALEESVEKDIAAVKDSLKKQARTMEEAARKQAESLDASSNQLQGQMRSIRFNRAIEDLRGRILKIKLDLAAKNIGTAKNELTLVQETLEKLSALSPEDRKELVSNLRTMLKKVKTEMDIDLASASGQIDLLWHETGRLFAKD